MAGTPGMGRNNFLLTTNAHISKAKVIFAILALSSFYKEKKELLFFCSLTVEQ
jgi:hypothetical protein